MEHLQTVLLWLLLAFLAGFVGQFGKSLTLRLLASRRRARAAKSESASAPTAAVPDAKLEKKRLKAELKARKKGRHD
jgi:hypothetical protein